MIKIGKVNSLIVQEETTSGYYLRDSEFGDEVFLPPAMAPSSIAIGDELDVFVYLDTKGGRVATIKVPYAEVGEFAFLKVVETPHFGAFFDLGIEKDLLVPGNEQKIKVNIDECHIVRICVEEGTDRVYGTTKLGKYIEASQCDMAVGERVEITIGNKTDLGYTVIINKNFIGMIYHNEIFRAINAGQKSEGFIKKVREDGLIDIALQKLGIKNLDEAKDLIFNVLKERDGKLPLNDKSSPEEIRSILGMSKKTFKSAIGMLYKDRKIVIGKDGISLIKS